MTNQIFSDHLPEFSRIVNITTLSKEEKPLKITATAQECEAIAKRLHIHQLEKLEASLYVKSNPQHTIFTVLTHLKADLTYICSLTLDPFKDHIKEDFSFKLGQTNQIPSSLEEEIIFNPEEEDIEEIVDSSGNIDLGEIMVQYLSLFLDPYPRSNTANQKSFKYEASSPKDHPKENPFSKLSMLKTK